MIVVTTPTGTIGHQVLENVIESGEKIRLVVRDASKIPTNLRDRVEVIEGSHGDGDVFDRAFSGAETVFWLCLPTSRQRVLRRPTSDSPGPQRRQ